MTLSIRHVRRRVGDTAGFDADAAAYIRAVQDADGAALEPAVARAINAFVLGCKADGIWSAIKSSCILMGARTLNGALTALVGSAVTNNNFVSGDYNRKDGLTGSTGAGKSINTNRANNADGQDDFHGAIYVTNVGNDAVWFGAGGTGSGATTMFKSATQFQTRCRASTLSNAGTIGTGLAGIARNASGSYTSRISGANTTINVTSQTPTTDTLCVFARNTASGIAAHASVRLTFFSTGTHLDLALLDTRVSDLYTAIGNAIP